MTKSNQPQLATILPRREHYAQSGAGAVSTVVDSFAHKSRYRDRMIVLGSPVTEPLNGARFVPAKPSLFWFFNKTRGYLTSAVNSVGSDIAFMEVHNRAAYIAFLRKKLPRTSLVLYLHNDPRTMKAAKTPTERQALGEQVQAIICVSAFIKKCFLEGTKGLDSKTFVVNNAVDTGEIFPLPATERRKEIIFVGRTIPDKGPHLLVEAAERLLPLFPDWKIIIVGGRYFGSDKSEAYEQKLFYRINQLGHQAEMTGYLPHADMLERLRCASIAVLPSLWDEPCGLVHIEASACGCAVITTNRGGIPEMLEKSAIYLTEETSHAVEKELRLLMENNSLLIDRQINSCSHARGNLDIVNATKLLDDIRAQFI